MADDSGEYYFSHRKKTTNGATDLLEQLTKANSPRGIRKQDDNSYFSSFAHCSLRLCVLIDLFVVVSVSCAYNEGIANGTWVEAPGNINDFDHLFAAISPVAVCELCCCYCCCDPDSLCAVVSGNAHILEVEMFFASFSTKSSSLDD